MELAQNAARLNSSPRSETQCYTPNFGLGGEGGGVVLQQSHLNMTHTVLTLNGAATLGGALVMTESNLKIQQSSFRNNSVQHQGGAIAVKDSMVTSIISANQVRFENNQQLQRHKHCQNDFTGGGAIAGSAKHQLRMEHTYFAHNSANGLVCAIHSMPCLTLANRVGVLHSCFRALELRAGLVTSVSSF